MPANPRQSAKRFRPTFDCCEGRELLSTLALVSSRSAPVALSVSNTPPSLVQVIPHALAGSGIHALSNEKIRGNNTAGYWSAGTSQFAIFAVQFDGALTKSNAQKAFDYGKAYVTSRKISLD